MKTVYISKLCFILFFYFQLHRQVHRIPETVHQRPPTEVREQLAVPRAGAVGSALPLHLPAAERGGLLQLSGRVDHLPRPPLHQGPLSALPLGPGKVTTTLIMNINKNSFHIYR